MNDLPISSFVPTIILQAAAACFNSARQSLIRGAGYLHHIKQQELWKESHESFGQYVESECHISQSFAAKLVKIYDHYVVAGGVSEQTLEGVDSERLYMALDLPGTTHEQVEKARLLTRRELKAELHEKEGVDCPHPEIIRICAVCKQRVE